MRPPTPHNTEEEVESEEMEMEEVHSEVLEEEYEEVENEDENGEKNEEENEEKDSEEEMDEVEQTLSSDPSQADVVEQTLSSDPPQADVVEQTLSSDPPQATSVRMRRRERGAYGIDGRGRTVTMISASQSTCSLQHLPIKTPSHTVRYAAGKDEAAYSALAAQLLQFPEALGDGTSAITHLPHMVSRLVDTSTTFLPPHPCPAPASPAPADLADWDCSGQVIHIRRLLQLAGRITIMAQYHVGGYLRQVVAAANTNTSKDRSHVLNALANTASKDNDQQYTAILSDCACEVCAGALCGLGQEGERMPCRASQVVAKFSRDSLANLTPTFFRQCIQMHAALPPTHALFTASVETVTITPTHARLLAVGLHQAVCSLQRLGAPLPRPISQLGLWHHFKVATRKVEAIDFVDGDGGYLVADHIPGLWDFVRARAPAITWQEGMRGHLVPFRCHGHDALELEHLYHCPDGAHHLGYEALCAARRIVARAATVSVHTAGEVDIHRRRLVCTIVITTSQGMSTSLGESLLRAGLSYPLPGAPVTYTTAFSEAQASRSGVFSIFPPSLATTHQLHPSQIRAALGPSSRSVQLLHDGEMYKVTGQSQLHNASHVLVWESREQDAGQGGFVRSRSPHLPAGVSPFIKVHSIICGYARESLSNEEFAHLPPEELEYALSIIFRGVFHYNAYEYDGHNIGRYINQGGLRQALDKLLSMARVGGKFEFSDVEEVAQQHCNCKFAKRRNFGAVLVAVKEIRLRRHAPTELLVNYGIEGYWLGFFARHCVDLGFDHPMVRIVLWCATSPQSHLPEKQRQAILREIPAHVQVPPDIIPP